MMKNILTLCLLLLFCHNLSAQKGKKDRSDKIYSAKGYGKYMEMKGDDYNKMDKATLQKLAISSRKTGDYRTSEKLYATLIEMGDKDPLNHLYYAQALQSNGRYLKAREHFKICDEMLREKANGEPYDQRARKGYDACNEIARMRALGKVEIENEIILNSGKFDFSPTYYKRGVLFVSTRNKAGAKRDRWLNDNFMDLYYAPLEEGNMLGKPELFASELNTDFHEGPSVFSNDEERIYFTRNDFSKGKRRKSKDGTTKLKIFTAKREGKKWVDIEELPFNNSEYDVCHPALSPDETMLVFAANLPGGFGNMDLWVSRYRKNAWQKPVNLGPKINTEGNEVFPFIHDDGTLFYSSNGLSTIGGLDVFMATQVFNHPDSLWEFPFNLGDPINSSADDFGVVMNKSKTEGFFTSSRDGGAGEDDIYRFKIQDGLDEVKPTPALPIDLCVYDDESRARIAGAELKVKRVAKKEVPTNNYITNKKGFTSCEMRAGEQYIVTVLKEGYLDVEETFIMPNTVNNLDEYCIGMERDPNAPVEEPPVAVTDDPEPNPDKLKTDPLPSINYEYNPEIKIEGPQVVGKVINEEYNKPLPRAQLMLLNRCTGEEIVMEVGEDGLFGFPLECGCEYVLQSSKNRFDSESQVISLLNKEDCDKAVEMNLAMQPSTTLEEMLASKPKTPSFSNMEELAEGDVIELKNIYYDYDKWNIRNDAARDLDDLVQLMNKYPSMEIELSSHTDRRGSDSYNETLSEKRAISAKQYLVEAGIPSERITAKGYGEYRLKNDCKFCSAADHQENRRTEVKITKLKRTN